MPLIHCIVDDTLSQATPDLRQTLLQFIDVMSLTSVANVSMYLVNFVNNKVKRWYCVRYVRILLFFDIIYFTR